MSSRNIETTKRGYDAFNAGDLEAALSAFHDSAVWIVNGESTIGGTYHGKAELAELFRRLGEKAPTVEPKRYLESGDAVV
ncbi:MAG: uncharacterized protein QOG37_583, partial [Mycobacterium sp.]|nr:uncharacterized protein [Mycobacterium sp.]